MSMPLAVMVEYSRELQKLASTGAAANQVARRVSNRDLALLALGATGATVVTHGGKRLLEDIRAGEQLRRGY